MNMSVTSAELYKEHYEADRHAQNLWDNDADNLNTISTEWNIVKGKSKTLLPICDGVSPFFANL